MLSLPSRRLVLSLTHNARRLARMIATSLLLLATSPHYLSFWHHTWKPIKDLSEIPPPNDGFTLRVWAQKLLQSKRREANLVQLVVSLP